MEPLGKLRTRTQLSVILSLSPPHLEHENTWITEAERGSRHRLDVAPFSRLHEAHDYNEPTLAQAKWIASTYNATMVEFTAPFIVISTERPSLPHHNGLVTVKRAD